MNSTAPENLPPKRQIKWTVVIILSVSHLLFLHAMYYIATLQFKWQTIPYNLLLYFFVLESITAGTHRLWAHRSYKATLPLRIFLCFFQTMAYQYDIYTWCRGHRTHHKYSDTDADPHNIKRGFFFAYVGWLVYTKHPDVISKGKTIDLSDLEADPVVMFQRKYYSVLGPLIWAVLPTLVPVYFWDERPYLALCGSMFRYILSLQVTLVVNSATHMWGYKPYDETIEPVDNKILTLVTAGEGWHNYHHAFPWDYRTGESTKFVDNFTGTMIELLSRVGLTYDLRTASAKVIEKRILRTGNVKYRKEIDK